MYKFYVRPSLQSHEMNSENLPFFSFRTMGRSRIRAETDSGALQLFNGNLNRDIHFHLKGPVSSKEKIKDVIMA